MIEPDLQLQKPLEDFIEILEKLSPRTVDLLDPVCSITLSLEDPYHVVQGRELCKTLLCRRLKLHDDARIRVHDFAWGRRDASAYIRWSLLYKPKKSLLKKRVDKDHSIEGMSEVLFLPERTIGGITDFFSASDGFNSRGYAEPIED